MMFSLRYTTFILLAFTRFALAGEVASSSVTSVASQQTAREDYSFEEWGRVIKNIDFESRTSEKYVPGLMRLLQNKNASAGLRERAALTLGRMGKRATDAIPLMVQLLAKTTVKEERLTLLKALSLFGPLAKSATTSAIVILENDTITVNERRAAMELLARIGVKESRTISALTHALQYRSTKKNNLSHADAALLRQTAAEKIAYIGPPAKSAIPALNRLLQDDNESVRRTAVAALGAIGMDAKTTFPQLFELMASDNSEAVRDAAMRAITKMGPTLLTDLKPHLQQKETALRRRIVKSICNMKKDAKPLLADITKMLQDEDADIRLTSATAIWQITNDATLVIPVSLQLLESHDRQIRKRAALLLIDLGKAATPAIVSLKKLQHHKKAEVRQVATHVLHKLKLTTGG